MKSCSKNAQKTLLFYHCVQCCSSVLAPVSIRAPILNTQYSLFWLVNSHTPEPAPLTTTEHLCSINLNVPNWPPGIHYANVWHCDTLWCQQGTVLETALLMRHFRCGAYCGRQELLLVRIFFMHKNSYNALNNRLPNCCSSSVALLKVQD